MGLLRTSRPSRNRPYSTWTWMRFSFRWNCWNGPSFAASPWWSAGGRTSAGSFPRRVTKRANTGFIRRCRCERRDGFARTRFFWMGITKNMESGATASPPSSRNFLRSWRWFRLTRPISTFPAPSVCMDRRWALRAMGIETVEQIAAVPQEKLETIFGQWGTALYRKARGGDSYEFVIDAEPKSISHNHTFGEDTRDSKRTRVRKRSAKPHVSTQISSPYFRNSFAFTAIRAEKSGYLA